MKRVKFHVYALIILQIENPREPIKAEKKIEDLYSYRATT